MFLGFLADQIKSDIPLFITSISSGVKFTNIKDVGYIQSNPVLFVLATTADQSAIQGSKEKNYTKKKKCIIYYFME